LRGLTRLPLRFGKPPSTMTAA